MRWNGKSELYCKLLEHKLRKLNSYRTCISLIRRCLERITFPKKPGPKSC